MQGVVDRSTISVNNILHAGGGSVAAEKPRSVNDDDASQRFTVHLVTPYSSLLPNSTPPPSPLPDNGKYVYAPAAMLRL
jgi:hypothetical protein